MKGLLLSAVLILVAFLAPTVFASRSAETGPMLLLEQPQPYTRWMDGLYVPLPPGEIRLRVGPGVCTNPLNAGCMEWTTPPTIGLTIATRSVFVHELGHVFDMVVLAKLGWRDRFAAIDGFPWQTPRSEERFADAYRLCAFNRELRNTIIRTSYGWEATPEKHQAVCTLIWEAAEALTPAG